MNHQVARWVFALGVGFAAAYFSYQWITNPAPREERQVEEAVVMAARQQLRDVIELQDLELVDPLAPDRVVGKGYVYRADDGWEISGYYRRGESDDWHAYLVRLDASYEVTNVRVQDARLAGAAERNTILEVLP